MKKIFALLLAGVLALSVLAMAEQPATTTDLETPGPVLMEGFVQEITGEYVLIVTRDGLQVQANLTEDTAYMAEGLEIGDYAHILYNGMMTRSLPAQITVMALGCDRIAGVVEELSEEGFLLRAEGWEDGVFVNADATQMNGVLVDMPVTVYFNGAVTPSLPPQVSAMHVRLMEIEGVVDEITEEGFLMTTVDGVQYRVAMADDVLLLIEPAAGEAVRVVYNGVATMSIPALINATEVLPAYGVAMIAD